MSRLNLRIDTLAMRAIWCVLLFAVSANGANLTVKSGGGGNYTTIQACATAMASGDTCTVYAGTYNENVTVSAGGVGLYKTITVNGSDIVKVNTFTLNSHTKLIGNCVKPAARESCGFSLGAQGTNAAITASCLSVSGGATDVYITNNVMYGCGNTTIISMGTVSFVYVQGNTLSYGCETATSPTNMCSGIFQGGNHILIENNDFSHLELVIQIFGQFVVARNNTFHDMNEGECGPSSGNCHMDLLYAERSNTDPNYLVQHQLWEGNTGNTSVGADAKGMWTAADNACTTCTNVIGRYNVIAHFGSGVAEQTSGFLNVKYYNNSFIDDGTNFHGSNATIGGYRDGTSTGGAQINNLYYFPFSVPSSWGWNPYYQNGSGATPGFTAGANLAFCSSSPCSLGNRFGTANGFATDSPVIASNILASSDPLVNYSAGDFHLAAGSPALNGGTHLTTVAAGDSGSGTSLVVTDAGFFQDGLGLNASGVQADCIAVTAVGNHICITAVNYATNTLTLASGITRSPGDPVWLYSDSKGRQVLVGSAPNIGAFGTAGSTPPVAITPSPVAFPKQTVGIQSSPPLTVTVSNTGSATLTLNTPYFTITGINAADFSNTGTGTCSNGGSVLAGNSCTVLLSFTPSVEGTETATLNISGNANGSATINGTGVPTPPTSLTDIVKP